LVISVGLRKSAEVENLKVRNEVARELGELVKVDDFRGTGGRISRAGGLS